MPWTNTTCDFCRQKTEYLFPWEDDHHTICILCLTMWPPIAPEQHEQFRIRIGLSQAVLFSMLISLLRNGNIMDAVTVLKGLTGWHTYDWRTHASRKER